MSIVYAGQAGRSSSQYDTPHTAAPFVFRKRHERVDWRKLASVNIESIARDLDFNTLQDNIMNITYCNIELELDLRLVDPNFIKLFKLAQLTIEYLLHSQDYLSETILDLECRLKDQSKEVENHKEKIKQLDVDLEKVRKEGHKRKKLLVEQQQLIDAGPHNFHKCLLCAKAFMNQTFLQNHMQRRHGTSLQEVVNTQNQTQNNELSLKISGELQEIRERLNYTEAQLAEERESLRQISKREATLLAERDAEHNRHLGEWQREREAQHRTEMQRLQDMFMAELREMQVKQAASQKALESAQQGIALSARASNLGSSLRDDSDYEKELIMKQREELARQQEELKIRMDDMQDVVKKQMAIQEAEWKKRMAEASVTQQQKMNEMERTLKDYESKVTKLRAQHKKDLDIRERHIEELVNSSVPVSKHTHQEERTHMSPAKVKVPALQTNGKKLPKTLTFADQKLLGSGKAALSSEETSVPAAPQMLAKNAVNVPKIVEVPPSESDQSEDSTESEEDTGATEPLSSMQTMSTQETLDLTGKSKQLRDAVVNNPQLLESMRTQMRAVLAEKLKRWDIDAEVKGISSSLLANKKQLLVQERLKSEKKYKNLAELRRKLSNRVDDMVKERLTNRNGNIRSSLEFTAGDKGGTMSSTGRTLTGSSTWGTSSSKWSAPEAAAAAPELISDDSEDELESYADDSSHKHPAASAKLMTSVNQAANAKGHKADVTKLTEDGDKQNGRSANGREQPPMEPIKVPSWGKAADESDSDWDEDDVSELKEYVPAVAAAKIEGGGDRNTGLIANRAAQIELQLKAHTGKAPVGGVKLLETPKDKHYGRQSPSTPEIPEMDDSSDHFSTSSAEDPKFRPNTGVKPRDSVESANTYGSSQWGPASTHNTISNKQVSDSLHSRQSREASIASDLTSVTGASAKRDSAASITDWSDSDLDI